MRNKKRRSSNKLSTPPITNTATSDKVGYQSNANESSVNQDEEKDSDDEFDSPNSNVNKPNNHQEKVETSQGIPMGNIRYDPLIRKDTYTINKM